MSATKEHEMTAVVDRRMAHLRIANDVRCGMAEVKRELAGGLLSVADALEDSRAQPMEISVLLMALPRWGRYRAVRLLSPLLISEARKVRDLPDRQRRLILRGTTRSS